MLHPPARPPTELLTTVDPFVGFASSLFVDGPRQSRGKIGQPRADGISDTWQEQRLLNVVPTSLEVLGVRSADRREPGREIVRIKVSKMYIGWLVSLQVLPGKISQRASGQRRVLDAEKYEMSYLRAARKVGTSDETKNAHEVVF
jgi:hypothetical protein